ncbi:hypothetical protein BX661DRAFT_85348 [Kickxella alabastrina]|uniref:uncharacterized protein n=1 Tax=Kickxella alabastrina TaxID=61397 RepID=UPI00221E8146|nr:uncharacterized protein BX661DRAFT_85348 [Kickxella alabastrina]KAI7831889.1 hypothetical protein BX661DRAFT_85348 [Kickxella alabastrina]
MRQIGSIRRRWRNECVLIGFTKKQALNAAISCRCALCIFLWPSHIVAVEQDVHVSAKLVDLKQRAVQLAVAQKQRLPRNPDVRSERRFGARMQTTARAVFRRKHAISLNVHSPHICLWYWLWSGSGFGFGFICKLLPSANNAHYAAAASGSGSGSGLGLFLFLFLDLSWAMAELLCHFHCTRVNIKLKVSSVSSTDGCGEKKPLTSAAVSLVLFWRAG